MATLRNVLTVLALAAVLVAGAVPAHAANVFIVNLDAGTVARRPRQAPRRRPAPVAVHDDRDVEGRSGFGGV